jgi:hypothetical protein
MHRMLPELIVLLLLQSLRTSLTSSNDPTKITVTLLKLGFSESLFKSTW